MKAIYMSHGGLNYRGKHIEHGQEVEISEAFYNAHKSRFKAVDNNLVIDGESEQIENIKPVEIRNVEPEPAPKKPRGRRSKAPK